MNAKTPGQRSTPAPKSKVEAKRSRDAVLSDFRKIVGPLRGQNRDRKPKA